jgi:citronellol/citronellal dehydrogenase
LAEGLALTRLNASTGATQMSLEGKTLFITGASRGIGLAIALRAARDGANIVIAAKTAEPHEHLPGTIYSAAGDVEAAGGKALPLLVDVRDEASVTRAVETAAQHFGGIDICVNNASAIQLTGTMQTEMKRYDLMHQVNARGTFLTSRACLPHLRKASNPHVLTISPPLDMNPRWFAGHTAYTMAKFGMSMCVLGLAEEFRADGVAFNALWPRTAIATAAIQFALGEEATLSRCRKPEIMADAAYAVFHKPSREFTGKFLIDDTFLYAEGVRDFDRYRVDPSEPLMPDFFVPESAPPPPGVSMAPSTPA